MERLTDCAQGYCEMYCKKYGHCFEDPGDCIFKDEIKMYDALKSIEGIVPFDRLLELADADRAGRLAVLPCKVGDTVYQVDYMTHSEALKSGVPQSQDHYQNRKYGRKRAEYLPLIVREKKMVKSLFREFGKTVFMNREEAEKALQEAEGNDLS